MQVHTLNSTYTVDFEAGTITRSSEVHGLRRDEEPLKYLKVEKPVTGKRWVMLLDLVGPGVVTVRETTEIQSIDGIQEWYDNIVAGMELKL